MDLQRVSEIPAPPAREDDSHKGNYGRVLVIAGGRGMAGAAALSGQGALRGGAGLVYVATAASVAPIISAIEPSYLVEMLPQDEHGMIAASPGEDPLRLLLAGKDALAVGPGLGQSPAIERLVDQLFRTVPVPLVCDADALNVLARSPKTFPQPAGPRILTPHPGEFARLTGAKIAEVQENRQEMAAEFARRKGVILLLKGHETIITDGRRLAINQTGNSGMATGGSGDILTGLITALLGQGMTPFEAAQFGAHLHGLAGDLAAEEVSQPGLIASDLAAYLGQAWLRCGSSG